MKTRYYISLKISSLLLLTLLLSSSAPDKKRLPSGMYEWENLKISRSGGAQVRKILKGPTKTLKMFEIKAVTLPGGYGATSYTVTQGFDELIILREGMAVITINGKFERLYEGSVIVASQGDEIKIENGAKNDLTYYSFRFCPRQNEGKPLTVNDVEPVMKEWRELDFKTNVNGGRRDIIRQPTSLMKELEIHTTQLRQGLSSHAAHTHPDEEIILVSLGRVEESVNGKLFRCGPGSLMFLTNDDNHGVRNIGEGSCEYYAIRWLTY